jgi:hypothetical protein
LPARGWRARRFAQKESRRNQGDHGGHDLKPPGILRLDASLRDEREPGVLLH